MPLNVRAEAARLLGQILFEGQSLSALLPAYKQKLHKSEDAAFLQTMVFGTLRHYFLLEKLYQPLLKTPLPEKDHICYPLICIGLYQLKFMRVPAHAALSETVEAVRVLGKGRLSGLINAVLRNYLRQCDTLEAQALKSIEAQYAHPAWLIKRIQRAWPEDWQSILAANNTQAPLSLRVNTRCITPSEYREMLNQAHIEAIQPEPETMPAAITLKTPQDVRTLPGFEAGCFYAQDIAAQVVAPLLDLKPGQRVLDVCAAPGGKTTHIAELEPQLAALIAVDNAPLRCARITENLERLQQSATVVVGDALTPEKWWDGQLFDRILVDAPCSATGVIRRHPDIKLLRRDSDIAELAKQQLALLRAAWPMLKPGGLLVYTTCSILPEENEQVIEAFMNDLSKQTTQNHPVPSIDPLHIPLTLSRAIGYQILPGTANCDGFYYVRLKKHL